MDLAHTLGTEPGTQRLLLIQGTYPQRQSRYRNAAYPTVEAQFVRVADMSEGGGKGYRWADWTNDRPTAKCLRNLIFRCDVYAGNDSRKYRLNRFRFEFDVLTTTMTYQEVARMQAVGKVLQKQHETLERAGHAVEFAIYLRSMADALGFKQIHGLAYDDDVSRGPLDTTAVTVLPSFATLMDRVRDIAEATLT